jgi:tRNA A-37 threonylcarbamoyl transferase component Bud32
MMPLTKARDQALHALFDQALEDFDAETQSPLYADLRSLQERYADAEVIAVGGMKRILKVLDRQSNRHVAMARLHEDASDLLFDPFIREARLTALLEHPNVISVHDVGVDRDGQPYFTMDLTAGDGLDVVLRKAHAGEGYPLSDRLEIFLKVCDAIDYAHSRKVIHLDIKPANIQVGQFGEVLVCDWGLGKLISDSREIPNDVLLNPDLLSEMTLSGEVKGTPGYMAPEQISGGARDERTDIYALGALLYAILTCRHPIDGDTESMLKATLAGQIVPPAVRDSSVPESLSSVVMKAMSRAPEDRYTSAHDLVKDLRAFLSGFSPAAHESGLATEILLFYRRHRAVCNVVVAFLAIVITVTAVFVDRLEARRTQAEELAARLHTEKQESEALLREVGELASPFRTDLDDKQMLGYGGQVSDDFFFQAPIVSHKLSLHSLKEVIQTRPESRSQALGLLGYLHFMAADFEKAAAYLTADKRMDGILRVNTEILATFDADAHKRSAAQLATVMVSVGRGLNRWRLAEKILTYDFAAHGYRAEYDQAVRVLLPGVTFDAATHTATIDSPEAGSLTPKSNRCPLRFLSVRRLIFLNTAISDASELGQLQTLELVDLRGTRISRTSSLASLPQLQHLIIRPGQFSTEQKAQLPPAVRIEERDLD